MTLRVGLSLLSLSEEQFTGTATYVRELVSELRTREAIELNVLRRAPGSRAQRTRAGRAATLAATMVPRNPAGRRLEMRAEVVHYPLTLPLPAVGCPTVVTLHDLQHHELPQNFTRAQRAWRWVTYDRAARHADVVITDSDHAREQIIERLKIRADRVMAVHLAVDHARFSPDGGHDDDELLRGLRLPRRFILYPASFWPHKNHRRLFGALSRLRQTDVCLVLTGATFGRDRELHALARAHGVENRLRHLGHVPEAAIPALYRRAEAAVVPSLFEGFGLAALEAMAAGCPVASSHRGSLGEVVDDCAVELDPCDEEQMAAAIERVLDDADLRSRLRTRGLARAARFSWRANADAHVRAYNLAVAHGGGR